MVGARGFEPPASRSRTVRSTKLSYAPTFCGPLHGQLPAETSHARGSTARTGRIPPPWPSVKREAEKGRSKDDKDCKDNKDKKDRTASMSFVLVVLVVLWVLRPFQLRCYAVFGLREQHHSLASAEAPQGLVWRYNHPATGGRHDARRVHRPLGARIPAAGTLGGQARRQDRGQDRRNAAHAAYSAASALWAGARRHTAGSGNHPE